MGRIMITCPTTKQPVNTGIYMDRTTYERSTPRNNKLTCPHCHQIHLWDKEDSYLQGD